MKNTQGNWSIIAGSVLFLCSLFALNWQPDRSKFIFITLFYTFAFVAYIFLIRRSNRVSFKNLAIIALLGQLVSMIYEPNLSIDYYRFIWDGEITLDGINPFDYKPDDLLKQYSSSAYMQEVYSGLGAQSSGNYSCYPTINQFYFLLSTFFTNSVASSAFVMKLSILITEIVGAIYLHKLLLHFKIHENRMWMLYLNPLWIIECTGNVHFEGVMVSFIFVSFYFIFTNRILLGGVLFALAIQVKLIPLLLLPFFFRYLGLWKSSLFYSLSVGLAVLLGFVYLDGGNIDHFRQSLLLYFKVFEFNSFILYNYIQYGRLTRDYSPIFKFGPQLSRLALFFIMVLSLWGDLPTWKIVLRRMMFGFFIYLLLSGTLHPWYVIPMLAISIFTNYSFPMVWSYLIFFSYFFYQVGNGSSFEVRFMVTIEYVILLTFVFIEIYRKGSLLKYFRMNHYLQPSAVS
ncbi:MAG: hypothetical protein MK066_13200 [Crocinitomicaceae bacterium]|nr:hypothetical protein [Crocinitomicaceae bacterium]